MKETHPTTVTSAKARYLTPRDVGQRIQHLTRRELSLRRTLGLPPRFEIISGCVMYPETEIECMRIETERSTHRLRHQLCGVARTATKGGHRGDYGIA